MMPGRRSAGVFAAGFCTFVNLYAPQAILPALIDTFGTTRAQIGLTVTAPLLAVAMVAPFVGSISDRVGRKTLIVAAAALLGLPTLAIAFAGSLETMLVWRFLQGLLLPFIFAVTVAYIGDECEGADGIRAAGTYSLGAIAGGFAGRFIAGVASDLGGWRVAFLVLAAIDAAGAVFVGLALPREQRFVAMTGGLRATFDTYGEHLVNRRLLATCGVGFGMLFSMVATFTYVNFYLAAAPFSLSPAALGFVFTVYLLGIATAPVATRLAVRIGRRWTLMLVIGFAAAGLIATLAQYLPVVIGGLAMVAGGLFVVQALSIGFIGTTVARAKSTAVGLYVTLYYIGGSLGGVAPAPLFNGFGWPGVVAVLLAIFSTMATLGWFYWRDDARN